jgi:hypothetical protein
MVALSQDPYDLVVGWKEVVSATCPLRKSANTQYPNHNRISHLLAQTVQLIPALALFPMPEVMSKLQESQRLTCADGGLSKRTGET